MVKTCKTNNKMADIVPNTLIITLNVKSLNTQVKRLKMTGWTHKQDSTICCFQETLFKYENIGRLKVKDWKNYLPCKS